MAEQVILPRQGQSVETCLILKWKKNEGDPVQEGEILVEVETDKAAFEIESTATGTLLKILHQEGEDVPVLAPLAVIGAPGEDISAALEQEAGEAPVASQGPAAPEAGIAASPGPGTAVAAVGAVSSNRTGKIAVSPRARRMIAGSGLTPEGVLSALPEGRGSGPRGRIVEQDVKRVLAETGPVVRPTAEIVAEATAAAPSPAATDFPGPVNEIPATGIRKLIAQRMLESLQSSAQYTLHASAQAEALLAFRTKLKNSSQELGLRDITISDLVNFTVTRVLLRYPALNSHFTGEKSLQFERVHLAEAVDTPRGLMVPVIRNASLLSLKQLAGEAARLRRACLEQTVSPDELGGGTFTVSNLGTFGIEGFTPVLNPPQVAILGLGSIQLKPEQDGEQVRFRRYLGLSLTANHQAVDGAPAAQFLRELIVALESFELLLAG